MPRKIPEHIDLETRARVEQILRDNGYVKKPPAVTITYEIKCNVCKHELKTDVFHDGRNMLINVPKGWTAVADEDNEQDVLRVWFYCEAHPPESL